MTAAKRCNRKLQPTVCTATNTHRVPRSKRQHTLAPALHYRSNIMQAQLQRTLWSDERGSAYVETLVLTTIGLTLATSLMAAGHFSLAPHFQHVVNAMLAATP